MGSPGTRVTIPWCSTCIGESRVMNWRKRNVLSPYRPAVFSSMYSSTTCRTAVGRRGSANMASNTEVETPELLCCPFKTVQVVLLLSPIARAWSSSTL